MKLLLGTFVINIVISNIAIIGLMEAKIHLRAVFPELF
jgi:hypothetical protein